MKNPYKGSILLKYFKDGPYSWVGKHYFYTPINKLSKKIYTVVKYKKNTQYYKPRKILNLRKYVDLHILKNVGETTWEDGNYEDLNKNKTLIIRCISKQDGGYIGCPYNTYKLLDLGITKFYTYDDTEGVCRIGFAPKKNIWYIWSENNVYGFNRGARKVSVEEVKEFAKELFVDMINLSRPNFTKEDLQELTKQEIEEIREKINSKKSEK